MTLLAYLQAAFASYLILAALGGFTWFPLRKRRHPRTYTDLRLMELPDVPFSARDAAWLNEVGVETELARDGRR